MGVIEEILKNKEELLIKFLQIIEGKEAKAKVDLGGVEFHIGDSTIKVKGEVELSFIPVKKKK